jgi:SAM-dependent MidA family methyltransferase
MVTFCDYMERALYGPAGYYSLGTAKSGRAGDYFTAPDVGPAFGQLLAEIFIDWEKKLNAKHFSIVEAGAGEGRLARDILQHHPFRYAVVERSPVRRQFLEKFETYSTLEEVPGFEGVLFGNELIDAFPVHRVQMKNGQLHELLIEGGDAKKRFVWGEPSTPRLEAYFDRLKIKLPDGYETEVNLAMSDWLTKAAKILQKGLLLLIDYGRPAHEYYAPERTRGTLRAFSKHKVSADFLDPSGLVDLTADVDFTSLALDGQTAGFTPLAFMEMGSFLMMGATHLNSFSKGLRYLIHPEGLGSAFHVLVMGVGIDPHDWVFEHNRLARLGLS